MGGREARIQFAQERRGSGDSSSRLPHKAPPDVENGIRRDIHHYCMSGGRSNSEGFHAYLLSCCRASLRPLDPTLSGP